MQKVIQTLKSEVMGRIKEQCPNVQNNSALGSVVEEIFESFMFYSENKIDSFDSQKVSDQSFKVGYTVRTSDYGSLLKSVQLFFGKSDLGEFEVKLIENAPLVQRNNEVSEREWYTEAKRVDLKVNKSGAFSYATYLSSGKKAIRTDAVSQYYSNYDYHGYSSSGIENFRSSSFHIINDTSNSADITNDSRRNNYLMNIDIRVLRDRESNKCSKLINYSRKDINKSNVVVFEDGSLTFRGVCGIDFIPEHGSFFQKLDVSLLERGMEKYSIPGLSDELREKAFENLSQSQRDELLKGENVPYFSELDENFYNAEFQKKETNKHM